MKYIDFFEKYNFPTIFKNLRGVDLPDFLGKPAIEVELPLPPILLPLITVNSWPGYRGVLFDPFGDFKSLTFIEYYIEGHEIVEIAKNKNQFFIWLLYSLYVNTEKIEACNQLSKTFDIFKSHDVVSEFDSIYYENELIRLDVFKTNSPAILNNDNNNGRPNWLNPDISINQIKDLIDKGELQKAWFGINSKFFHQEDILKTLHRISSKLTKNKVLFDDLISCWEAANHLMWNPRQ